MACHKQLYKESSSCEAGFFAGRNFKKRTYSDPDLFQGKPKHFFEPFIDVLPCSLLWTSAAINFSDVPLTPQLLCSNSTVPSASFFLLSFLCVPLFYLLFSHICCLLPIMFLLLQMTPIHRSVHHDPLTDCKCILHGEVLPSNAHNTRSLVVIFHERLSCSCVSVLCWCFTTLLIVSLLIICCCHFVHLSPLQDLPTQRLSSLPCLFLHCILSPTTTVNLLCIPATCKWTANETSMI